MTQALGFAAKAHRGQEVPGTDLPYLLHLSQLMSEVLTALAVEPAEDGELSVLCAVLHDCVEDVGVTVEEVTTRFGEAVGAGVAALTKSKDKEKFPEKTDQMADSLRRIRLQPQAVWKVKLADRITNLQPPPAHWSRAKAERYRAEAVGILEALGEASPVLSGRLRERIERYGALLPAA